MGNEFGLAAVKPVSSVAVQDAKSLVEPAPLGENADELLQDVHRHFTRRPRERVVFHLLIPPLTGYIKRIHSEAESKQKEVCLNV